MTRKKNIVKQSLLVGALTSSFGVFISKALGLLYYSPLNALAGEENMAFYSITYTYYDLLLKISSAGIPFAIAALVAKYIAKKDYKTALLVKKLGTSLVMGLSFICAIVFILISGPLAKQSMGSFASSSDIEHLKTLFLILLIAVILVPYLSVIRSYYQGLKRLDLYASSQVLEQLVRVLTIVVAGYIVVKVINLENIWAIYTAIAAAGFAALIAIVFFKLMTKSDDKQINDLIKSQESKAVASKEIFKEIVSLGVPYLLISFLGTTGPLINTTFFLNYVTTRGNMTLGNAKLALGILQANCSKLNAIPQVLTSGFCAGLVPYLTESLEVGDYNKLSKQVVQILDTVLFILIPTLLIFVFFAKDIYYIMYGNNNLELGASLFRASNALGFTETVLPILSSIMITLRLKKESILTLLGGTVVKTVSFFIFVKHFHAYGMVMSTCLASIISISIYIVTLKAKFDIRFVKTLRRMLFIVAASLAMVLPAVLLHSFIPFNYDSRLIDIAIMIVLGLLMLIIYYFVSVWLSLPQTIFNIKKPSITKLIKRFKLKKSQDIE